MAKSSSSELSKAKPISEIKQRNLWVIYGRSSSGKTALLGTFPKPMLYLRIGDDGANTIKQFEGIDIIDIKDIAHLERISAELREGSKYKTVAVDTFGMIVSEWIDENAIQKKKRVSQQMWGDMKVDTEKLIRMFHQNAKDHIVVLTCHEVADDSFEGLEDEILPDIRPAVSKGARSYLEGMANFGVHTVIKSKEVTNSEGKTEEVARYAIQLGANPYYWTKVQADPRTKIPKVIYNPTYKKIMKALEVNRDE